MPSNFKRLLVTAGPTREMLDPVRFLSNVSTGHMGYQIAAQAKKMGFKVTLVSGPVSIQVPRGVKCVSVLSADDMRKAVFHAWPKTDILIMTAAVCDYTPVRFSPSKIKRIKKKSIQFKRTADILAAVGKRKAGRLVVGFALETESVQKNAVQKLKSKNLDLIVANWYGKRNNPFGDNHTSMLLIDREGVRKRLSAVSKSLAAKTILREVSALLASKNR